MKTKLLVSVSGGETSMFMAKWLWDHKQDEYDMIFVFANTGEENEETLQFVKVCQEYFKIPVVWVEAVVHEGRNGTTHKIVDFYSASRDGNPYEDVIKKYGIPNMIYKHCTRELKEQPIKSYARSIGWKGYYTAIGIRADEIDRMASKRKELRLIYPLISMQPMTKPKINFWWSQQPFRLNLKGYQGNCKWCWKKSDLKLMTIAKENPSAFDFPAKMEIKYENLTPSSRNQNEAKPPYRFFRGKKSVNDILEMSKNIDKYAQDDTIEYDEESCEVFSMCGIDN